MDSTEIIPTPMISVQEVIVSELTLRGKGNDISDPVRRVLQVYSKKGNLIAERDDYGIFTSDQMIDFAIFFHADIESNHPRESFGKWLSSLNK